MPTVPRLTERQVRIRPESTPFQTGRGAELAAFGGGQGLTQLAQGLGNLGEAANRIGIQEQEREAKELDIQYTNQRRQILYGDGTEQNPGFYGLKGQAALQAAPEVEQQLEKLRENLASSASSGGVRRLFNLNSGVRISQDLTGMSRYTNEQRLVAQNTTSEVRIKEAIDDAVLGYNDPDVLTQSEVIIRGEVFNQAEINGWGDEVVQSKIEEGRTLLYRDTIVSAIKKNDVSSARALFDKLKSKMDAPVAAEVEEMLKGSSLRAEAQQEVDAIMKATPDPQTALKQARAITDPELRDAVVDRVRQRVAEDQSAERAATKDAKAEAYAHVWQGGQLDAWMTENPEKARLVTSDGVTVSSLLQAQVMFAEGQDFAHRSNPDTIQSFLEMTASEQAEFDLNSVRHELTSNDWDRFARMQAGARATLGDNAKARADQNFARSILRSVVGDQVVWTGDDQSDEDRKLKNSLTSQMSEFVQTFADRGVSPSANEIQAEAQRLTTQIEFSPTREGIVGTVLDALGIQQDALVAEIDDMDAREKASIRVDIDNIPNAVQDQVKEVFKKEGRQATEDAIEQFVGAELVGDAARQRRLLGLEPDNTVPLP